MAEHLTASGGQRRLSKLGASVDKATDVSGTVRRILSYWKGERWLLFLLVLLSLLSVVCTLLCPFLLGLTVDDCITLAQSKGDLYWMPLLKHLALFALLHLLSAAFTWIHEYGMSVLAQRLLRDLKESMTKKLLSLSPRFFNEHLCGTLMSHFTSDAELVKNALGDTLVQIVTSILTLIGSVVIMLQLSWQLTIATCLTVPFAVLLSRFVMRHTRKHFSQQQQALGEMNGLVEESVGGIKTIRSFGREEERIAQFEALNKEVCETGRKAQIYSGVLMPMMRVLDNCSYILVTIVGAFLASRGSITVGVVQSFLLYTKNFQRPINSIATQLNTVQSAIAGAERVFKLLDEKLEIEECDAPQSLTNLRGRIDFEHVSFGYGDQLVLKDLSFTAMPGEVVAVVGFTGAGKTTIINLLNRFYDVSEGSVKIDGVDVRDMSLLDLRRSIGLVQQEPFLFSDTLNYNVAYGEIDMKMDRVKESVRLANAEALVDRMADGYETSLLEQGAGISHGQRQLLTIAREVYKNAPILVLDEATSNIDTRTEILIQNAISTISKGHTCLFIAHRLSTIKNADKILVLENGVIVEQGRHEELLAKQGVYWRIYNSQFVVEE
ncbi:MAG: ABC transporter ATP-binding protein/permease [Paludibacteraceae bacterium]|nr:ABC transporter ATP-binding protein/permease [Paludibacteraceae bacterium]